MTISLKEAAVAAATSAVILMSGGVVKAGGTATGFFINAQGDIVTNNHVALGSYFEKNGKKYPAPCGKMIAYFKHNIFPLRIIATDPHNDLAVLRIVGSAKPNQRFVARHSGSRSQRLNRGWTNISHTMTPGRRLRRDQKPPRSTIGNVTFNYIPLSFSSPWQGGKVHVFGFPISSRLSSQLKVSSGSVNATTGFWNNSSSFQIDASVHSGNSGSPVLDSRGNLIGIITSGLNKYAGVNFAVKSDVLHAFLRGNNIKYEYRYKKEKTTAESLYYQMKESVVHLTCFDADKKK
jgi:S1-C subfamily serine protease